MQIVHEDTVFELEPGATPDYNRNNPLTDVVRLLEGMRFAAGRQFYVADRTEHLLPIASLELYCPSNPNQNVLDPTKQDFKTDFQKQNVHRFTTGHTFLTRGWVSTSSWSAPFLRVVYRGGPDTPLSQASGHAMGDRIKLWIKVGDVVTPVLIEVPYNDETDRYEVELWGHPGGDLRGQLDARGQTALDRGELQPRNDLVRGSLADLAREGKDDRSMLDIATYHTMHPILPLHIQLAWTDRSEQFWDSQAGENYHYEFNMIVRGWDNYLGVGMSANPHGGIGFLKYRNLLSNYFRYSERNELGRKLEPWNLNAFGTKQHDNGFEKFFTVDYMDLHVLKPNAGIGLHRHRDNQEVFLVMQGRGLMVVGDWCKMPQRERCLEVRTLRPGQLAMLKGGNLHALLNPTDEETQLFMFGGYD